MNKAIIINESDNVAVALCNLKKGEAILGITLLQDIPEKHKFSIKDINENESVIKYGYPIGKATESIATGMHVHSHNLKTALSEKDTYSFSGDFPYSTEESNITFMGYLRENGTVGIRNRILIIPTVGCANKAVEEIAKRVVDETGVDKNTVLAITHPFGCSQLGEDAENTAKCISALIKNPNVGGALLVSLGCENNNLDVMAPFIDDCDKNRVRTLNMQEADDEIYEGVQIVKEIYRIIKNDVRTPQPIEKLTIGFKCGGSDAFSGITANPLCGALCDRLTNQGAKVILTEVPEMFGAEKILMGRCVSKPVWEKSVRLIDSFKEYFTRHGQVVYENPSPGNKAGGITTLEEKSLGCITKGGLSPVTDVLGLYEPCKSNGLSLLWGPGNDIVSVTNLACAGANIILFTTGRGTPLGAPVPTMKISTNTELATKKSKWIDFDAGFLLHTGDFITATDKLLSKVIAIANGENTLNETNGYEEISIFKDGIIL